MEKTSYYYIFALLAILLLLNFQMTTSLVTQLATDHDQSALLALKAHITSDPFRLITRNWTNNSSSVCSWIGVTCNSRHHRVAALNISNMGLVGTIPPQLGNLSFLISLDFRYNSFTGNLPEELSRLQRLKSIDLSVNNFSGQIPQWFGFLSELHTLSLGNNSFTGSIPHSISNLSNLQQLDFSYNSLEGNIPEELGRLKNLEYLYIQFNHLSGSIPSNLFNISSLKSLGFTSNTLSGILPSHMCRNLPFLKRILLSLNQLSGPIPSNISQSSQLEYLSLSFNSFSGQIPGEIVKLTSLRMLHLGTNKLNGVIPEHIGNLGNLVALGLSENNITGALPVSIFNISSLQSLGLWNNKLTGSLPREIGNLTKLQQFSLLNNELTGPLPRGIGKLYELGYLSVELNKLTGSIPAELFNISTLRKLGLSGNGFSGSLPTNLGDGLPILQELHVSKNYITGSIPDSISNCSMLQSIFLTSNDFTGFVPHFFGNLRLLRRLSLTGNNLRSNTESSSELSFITSLTNCTFLTLLAIDNNPLDGMIIPSSIGNLSNLQIFYAYNCKIKGNIPEEIGNLSNLMLLNLAANDLTGKIPFSVKHLQKLQGLDIRHNKIQGPIPNDLCDLHNLVDLKLSQNRFSGSIPECLGNVTSLRSLFLDSNMLTSSIPSTLWQIKDLLQLDLSSNSLTASLHPEIGNLVKAAYIDLSMNNLSGDIPSTVGNLQALASLSLAHNTLNGPIPASIGSMISLVFLDLSFNNISGSIPKSLDRLQYLDYFNVSFNFLSGEIPSAGPFRNFTLESFKGNEALCGSPRFNVSPCISNTISKHRSSKKKRLTRALIVLAGVVSLVIVIGSLAFILSRNRWRNKLDTGNGGLESNAPERFSYYELLRATEQFSDSNLLGAGGFGSVYKATMRDGKVLAVKVFKLELQGVFKSFDVECEVLRNIRHRNLTKVVGSCSKEDFKALVLEYMPKESLEKWLYSHNYFLDFAQRLNIMIDVASALEYLHHGYSSQIVHCDLKPSNVLLDEEMIAHVSDFGNAKLLGEGQSISQTETLATIGYMAPEYGLEGLVSTRGDVYSYGIMLIETFTRKRPSDEMFGEGYTLKIWVERSLPNQVIDTNLLMHHPEDGKHFDKHMQCVSSILELALKCLAECPRDRIDMKEALSELQKIKRQFLM